MFIVASLIACVNRTSRNDVSNAIGFEGTWELISRIDKTENDSTVNEPTLGSDPIALLMYDSFGNMSVQIMKRNRTDSIITNNKINSNNSNTYNGYDAYFGTYTIDSSKHEVNHNIKGTIDKKDIGKVLTRKYSISQDTLQLFFSTNNGNLPVTRTLTWIRVKK